MTGDRNLRTSDFDYELPAALIAQHPPPVRGASRLLVVEPTRGDLRDLTFEDFPTLPAPGDLVVLNTTRVRHARFLATRPSGAPAEVLLIHPAAGDTWIALGRPGSALRPGRRVRIGPDAAIETIAVLDDGQRQVRFVGCTAAEAIAAWGRLPLPPYISRSPDAVDEDRYQTVYAEREGSVAAPTAGLHLTPAILEGLTRRGVDVAKLDLEVGPGTFKPVEGEEIHDHPMHPERYDIPDATASAIGRARARGGRVWAVGTTVVRALESAADGAGGVRSGGGETRLMITPGYRLQVVEALVTNFHLPRSTLLMLVAAFTGMEGWRTAYAHARAGRYRFYSYGDAMAILPRDPAAPPRA